MCLPPPGLFFPRIIRYKKFDFFFSPSWFEFTWVFVYFQILKRIPAGKIAIILINNLKTCLDSILLVSLMNTLVPKMVVALGIIFVIVRINELFLLSV